MCKNSSILYNSLVQYIYSIEYLKKSAQNYGVSFRKLHYLDMYVKIKSKFKSKVTVRPNILIEVYRHIKYRIIISTDILVT